MSLITDINTIVTGLYPDATHILSSKFKANLKSFSVQSSELPLIILDNELTKEAEIKKNNNVQKLTRIVISVLNSDVSDNSDAESEAIREACEVIADRIAVNIYQLPEVRPAGNMKYKLTPAFHVFTTNLTGVILDMQVNYNTVIEFCKP
jgi:hypothetical protein